MAKKKRRPRNRPPIATPGPPPPVPARTTTEPRGGATQARRERKAEARAAREAARKRAQRAAALRRAAIFAGVGVVLFGVVWWVQRAASPRPIPEAAIQAAEAAGCTGVSRPVSDAPGGEHLASGESHTYDQHPATSGVHDPSPLSTSPEIYTEPVPETQAVHFLEHAGVIVYYRADGPDALPQDVIDALGSVATQRPNTLLAPYPDLPDGSSLAVTAWNELQTCPGSVTAAQATTIANGFAEAFACTGNAPEASQSPDC